MRIRHFLPVVILLTSGCGEQPEAIEGNAFHNPDSISTIWSRRQTLAEYNRDGRAKAQPIPGVSIRLCFDSEGKQPIAGYTALTNEEGDYRIPLKGLPPPKDPKGWYYLAVEKEGYDGFVFKLSIGPAARRYISNTIVLETEISKRKRLKDSEK